MNRSNALSPVVALVLAGGAATAFAGDESDPYVFGFSQAVSAENNLFRAPDGQPVSRDAISSTGLRAAIDQPFGRQHFTAGLEANVNRYKNNTQLNNTDHRLSARLDWSTIERVSGELTAEQRSSLYRYDLDSQNRYTGKNQLRTTGAGLQVRVGVVTAWTLEGGWAGNQSRYSAEQFTNRDVRQQTVNAGVRWADADALSVRVGGRHTEGRFPNFGVEPDEFRRNDVDLSLLAKPNGLSTLNARVSVTRETHSVQSQRDENTWTGALGWNWQATGKLNFDTQLSRDSSVGSSTFGTALNEIDSSDTRVSHSLQLKARWDATAKIQLTAQGGYTRRKLDNAFIVNGVTAPAEGEDKTATYGLGIAWQPLRSLQFACNVAREHRQIVGDNITITYPYSATSASCSGQVSIR